MMRIRPPLRSTALLLLAFGLAACEDPIETGPDSITVSGTLDNVSGEAVPANARVVVLWIVSSGSPDYSYVFGEGELTGDGGGFTLSLSAPPPQAALNAYEGGAFGLGLVLLITDQEIETGDDIMDPEAAGVIGVAGQYAIIYREGAVPESGVEWVGSFEAGYAVGRGIDLPGSFDGFEPVSPSSVILTVDDVDDIELVNWT